VDLERVHAHRLGIRVAQRVDAGGIRHTRPYPVVGVGGGAWPPMTVCTSAAVKTAQASKTTPIAAAPGLDPPPAVGRAHARLPQAASSHAVSTATSAVDPLLMHPPVNWARQPPWSAPLVETHVQVTDPESSGELESASVARG